MVELTQRAEEAEAEDIKAKVGAFVADPKTTLSDLLAASYELGVIKDKLQGESDNENKVGGLVGFLSPAHGIASYLFSLWNPFQQNVVKDAQVTVNNEIEKRKKKTNDK